MPTRFPSSSSVPCTRGRAPFRAALFGSHRLTTQCRLQMSFAPYSPFPPCRWFATYRVKWRKIRVEAEVLRNYVRVVDFLWRAAMPAVLVPPERIPQLAAQIDSPAMPRVLRRLRETGFVQHSPDIDKGTITILQRLAELGLVDPGYDGPARGEPFIW